MRKLTDLTKVKEAAKCFLEMDVTKTDLPFLIYHPFTYSEMVTYQKSGKFEMKSIFEEGAFEEWKKFKRESIDDANLNEIFYMLEKPYILNFLKFTYKYMNAKDLGMILRTHWTRIEQISLDPSVTGKELLKWFAIADKEELMDREEYQKYLDLPNEVTIYRGVTSYNNQEKRALSWTLSKDTAEWFANRFQTDSGEVWKLTVPKERILCYFANRGESEVIVDLYGFNF